MAKTYRNAVNVSDARMRAMHQRRLEYQTPFKILARELGVSARTLAVKYKEWKLRMELPA